MGGKIQSLQILDRDARLDEFVDAMEGSHARPLHVWRRDAIESYLILPDVMARVVATRRPDADAAEVTRFVERVYSEAIEELRDATFDRVATRYRRDIIARDART